MARYSRQGVNAEADETEINMTPMLDVVFIMLIFFIVTAVFVKEAGIEVLRPEASGAQDIKRVSTLIGISNDNEIWIDKKQVTLEEVPVLVSQLKAENPKGQVVVLADASAHSGLVVEVVERLNQIGVAGVALASKRGN